MENIEKIDLGSNVNLTLINSKKFKTNLISVYIQRMLDKEEVTKNALITNLISSGSKIYPSYRDISNKLDNLYGANLIADASKRGERQIITFKLISTNEKYLDEKIFGESIKFLNEIINNPLIVDGGFDEKYMNLEKENLRNRIKSIINDKSRYSLERCFEEMCKDERFGISEYGYEEDIDAIDGVSLYNHYKTILKTSSIEIVIEGEFDKNDVVNTIKENFIFDRSSIKEIQREDYIKNVSKVNEVIDHLEVNQGKLVMGYRTNVDFKDNKKYYALMVGNGVFGGGPHSKLFMNVREKESLCYYVFSSIEKYKGIMFVSSGIETKDYEKAKNLIDEQLLKVKNKEISKDEIRNSKNALINSVKSLKDSLGGMSDFYFAQSIGQTNNTIEDMIKSIEEVTIDDIVNSFKDIQLDTIYFLRD